MGPEKAEKTAREKRAGEAKQEADARTAELTREGTVLEELLY